MLHCLRQQCISRGCRTLNQLQLLFGISGRAKSVLELLLLRLDEQGLDISSPWTINRDNSIVSVLWPKLYAAWLSKECRELDEDVRSKREQALLCLAACARLGNAKPAILSISQFQGTQTQWLRSDELANRNCHLSPLEHTALTSWLSMPETQQLEMSAAASRTPVAMEDRSGFSSTLSQRSHSAVRNAEKTVDPDGLEQTSPGTARAEAKWQDPLRCPPCIQGEISGVKPHEQLVLQCTLQSGLPEVDISTGTISDQQLLEYLCQTLAVFSYPRNNEDILSVECLVPLRAVMDPYIFSQEYAVVCLFGDDSAPLAVMHIALIRDCLRGVDHERLRIACSRPSWTVASDEFYAGLCFTNSGESSSIPIWRLYTNHSTTQRELTGLVQYITHRRRSGIPRQQPIPHPWQARQAEPHLPISVTIDISHHLPRSLPAPVGWEVIQRNGRIWLIEQNS